MAIGPGLRSLTFGLAIAQLLTTSPYAQQSVGPGNGDDGRGPRVEHQVAVLQGLDKITARVSPIYATLGLPTYFGSLEIVVRTCKETPPTEAPESAAFLEIRELPPNADHEREPEMLFSGWMFASSPAVSALEHPVYDVWLVDCEEPTGPQLDSQGVPEDTGPPSE